MTETANSDEKKLLSVATRSDAQLWLCANTIFRDRLAHPEPYLFPPQRAVSDYHIEL